MKLLSFFILISAITTLAANSYSQQTKFNISFRSATVREVLQKIEDSSEFIFLYSEKSVDVDRKVDINVTNQTVDVVLDQLFNGTRNFYEIRNRQISILEKGSTENSYLKIGTESSQQPKSISGKVTDSSGALLPGVSVVVKGTTIGVITDMDGKYTLAKVPVNAVLQYSFVGMKTQEIAVGSKTIINVVLVEETIGLEEVVAVGYGTQKKINITGSVATVSASELKSVPVKDVGTAIVGRLPGILAVNTGGVPGQNSPNISIRGYENMLVVVDGVEYPFNWDQLEMVDIESISVLKDASAAIYGARAGNGVLLITTKRGKTGDAPKFNFTASYGIETPIRQLHAVDAATLATMENDANVGSFTPEQIQKYKDGSDPAYPNTDWLREVMNKTAPIQHYNLNSIGGNEKINYFYSLGYFKNDGLLKSGDINFNRFNFRSNIEAKVARGLTASFDISGRQEKLTGPGATGGSSSDINGLYQWVLSSINMSQPFFPAHYPDPTKLAFAGHGATEPLGVSNKDYAGYTDVDNKYLTAAVSIKYDVSSVKGLSAKARFSTDQQFSYTKQFAKAFYYYMYDAETKIYSDPLPSEQTQTSDRESIYRSSNYTSQFQVNYDKIIGNHTFNMLALAEYNSFGNNSLMGFRKNYISNAIEQLFAGGDKDKDATGDQYKDGRIGYAGRLNYSYAGKYLLETTIRYDGSSKYAPAKRWGAFPSLSLAWRLSEEPFLKNSPSISNLKLRATIGKSGFDAIEAYKYLTGYVYGPSGSSSGGAVFGNTIYKGIYSTGIANPNLVWQTATEYNLGLDAGFLKNLISFELDAFYRKVTNVAGYRNASIPYTFGAGLPLEPINSYDNRGIELQVKHENTVGELRYSVSGQVTYARSKWVHFDEPTYSDPFTKSRLQTSGQWRNRLIGYKALGLFQSQGEIDGWADQDDQGNATIKPGDIKYEDYNKDGKIDGNDTHTIGKGFTPDMIFSMNFSLQYKGFDLNALFQGASGFNSFFHQIPFENSTVPFEYMTDYWTPTNTDAKLPRLVAGEAINNQRFSSFWLKDATYLRLKNLTIGYTIPKDLCAKLHISSCRVYVTGLNLFILDKDQVTDPEAGNSWFTSGAKDVPVITNGMYPYPLMKNYQIGLDLQF